MTEDGQKTLWLETAQSFFLAGDFGGMRACAREILTADLEDVDGLALLAQASVYLGEHKAAVRLSQRVLQLAPNHWRNLLVLGELARAELQLRESVRLLGRLWRMGRRTRAAIAAADLAVLERAGRLLADNLTLLAEPEQASQLLMELVELVQGQENKADIYSKALFLSNFTRQPVQQMLARHAAYNGFFAGLGRLPRREPQAAGHKRRLRVGYISADFRRHAMANLLTPFLRDYTKQEYTVYVYMAGEADEVTKRFHRFAVVWRDVAGLSAEETAMCIYRDKIDILVDFTGHSQHSCLPVLARRPAPLQLSGLGYINTTGLRETDFFLSDSTAMPEADGNKGFTEQVVRLPHQLCYVPETVQELPPAASRPPCLDNGYVTFGSFNDFAKVSQETLLLWRGILEAVPGSRLLVKGRIASLEDGRASALEKMQAVGIDKERVDLRPYSEDYLQEYREVDIALDTTPYTGGITTCEALVMGVPVITLRGSTHASRFSTSVLQAAGLPELIASGSTDYVNKAVQLATTPALLEKLHSGLRQELLGSPLMDSRGYMQEVETLYQNLWASRGNGQT